MQHSNYPDDIRRYDNDPRSPFYVEPDYCDECGDDELEDGRCASCCSSARAETPYMKGWELKYNPKPIPDRSHDWDYWHEDDEELFGFARTRADAKDAIFELYMESDQ